MVHPASAHYHPTQHGLVGAERAQHPGERSGQSASYKRESRLGGDEHLPEMSSVPHPKRPPAFFLV